MLILTAPGQGAQTPGFLSPWLEIPGVAENIGAWSELAGRDLARLGTTGQADEITDTAVAQPLLVAAALAVAALLPEPDAAAGHSVGELAAGAIAGVLSPAHAIALTAVRGNAMREACDATPTGMTAVLGGDTDEVLAAIAAAGATPANVNGAGQVVAGGTLEQLAALAASPPAGARLRALKVAGAFHTEHMGPAVDALAVAAGMRVVVKDPAITLLSNRDGAVVTSGANWVERIIAQVAAPVRWDLCMETMSDIGVTALVELVPGGTLANLAKRALPGMELLALKTPDQLDAAAAMIRAHNPASGGDHAAAGHSPEWRIVVAPAGGKFRPAGIEPGALVEAGAVLGQVDARSGPVPVTAGPGGVIVEWLAEDGDPVGAGRPLARLQPATADQASTGGPAAAGAREA